MFCGISRWSREPFFFLCVCSSPRVIIELAGPDMSSAFALGLCLLYKRLFFWPYTGPQKPRFEIVKAHVSYRTSAPPAQLISQNCETKPGVTLSSRRHALRPHPSFPSLCLRDVDELLVFRRPSSASVCDGSVDIGRDCCYFSPLTRHFHMADDELVDPKKYLEEGCKPKCVKPLLVYQACVKRIEGDESGHKHCTGQYFDYWSCVDKCVAPKLFSKVK